LPTSPSSKTWSAKSTASNPATTATALIAGMIKDNKFGLKSFKMVESSEAGMLIEAQRAIKDQKAIVFLGWEPTP